MNAPSDLLRAAASGQPVALPPGLARQLLACATDAELASTLGLSRVDRIRARNAALVAAARVLSSDGCPPWQAASRLAQAIRRFKRTLLPALQHGANLQLSPHEAALWDACKLPGIRILSSPRKLYDLLVLHG